MVPAVEQESRGTSFCCPDRYASLSTPAKLVGGMRNRCSIGELTPGQTPSDTGLHTRDSWA